MPRCYVDGCDCEFESGAPGTVDGEKPLCEFHAAPDLYDKLCEDRLMGCGDFEWGDPPFHPPGGYRHNYRTPRDPWHR